MTELPATTHERAAVVVVRESEREVAAAEALEVLRVAHAEEYRAELADLVAAIGEGELDDAQQATLEQVLELGLQAGRIRAVYGPQGEQAALKLYRRLPRGSELTRGASGVTEALAALAGKELESLAVNAVGPGAFTLTLQAGGIELTVRLDRQGARLASVGV